MMNASPHMSDKRSRFRPALQTVTVSCLCLLGLCAYAADCVPASNGLIGWWPADGNANNVFGTNNGTLQGGATATAAGLSGPAFTLDGTNGFVQIPNSPLLRPTNFTVETWVRFASLDSAGSGGSPAGDQYIVFRQNSRNSNFEGFDLSKTRVAGSDYFRFIVSSAAGLSLQLRSSTVVSTGLWYHVAASRGSNFLQLYVNGALEQQTSISFAQDYGNLPLYLGTSGQSFWDHKLKGNVDEFSFYDRPLGSNEIAAIYAAGAAAKCKAPVITGQPQSTVVVAGSNSTFSVSASGFGPLSYQWQSNSAAIPGATAASLTITNPQPGFSADYTVVVTNVLGSLTSTVARLLFPPGFIQGPANTTNVAGSNAFFSASVWGEQPMGLSWLFNGEPLSDDARHSGTSTTNLSITGLVEADGGGYSLLASNAYGTATSTVATLTVLLPATIITQPASQYPFPNENASFTVTAKGTSPLSYRWFYQNSPVADGGRISGASTNSLTIQNVQAGDLGSYFVVVSNAYGSATSLVVSVSFAVKHYVDVNSAGPVAPYLDWSSAATTIQAAINAANPGDWIIVTNGTYQTGATVVKADQGNTIQNRVAAAIPVTIRSVNGPNATKIQGAGSIRSVYLTNGASMAGFTISGANIPFKSSAGYDDWEGGGVLCDTTSAVISNCVISGNSAPYGGGAFRGTLVNCVIKGNSALGQGGGAYTSTLINCTVVANHAQYGGGMGWCTVTNSIIYFNSVDSPWTTTNHFSSTIVNSCTTPDPGGTGNITDPPLFVDSASGNYRQQSNSPSVNAGLAVFALNSLDLDGAPRVVDGAIDLGAYEFQRVPFILLQPTNQTLLMFSNVLFAVGAIGDQPLVYIWQHAGTNVVDDSRTIGSGTPFLSITNLLAQDAGNYSVIISNNSGSVTSAVATLTLLGPPIIATQPATQTVPAGTNATFSVSAQGITTLSYQWRFNGTNLTSRTNSSLTLTNVQAAHAGAYDVVITNSYGALTSSIAMLAVSAVPPTITAQPASRVASVGQTVSFTVAAKGSEPMTCQWQRNGSDLPTATGFTLTLSNVNAGVSGTYRAAVSNVIGGVFSTNVTLVVSPVLIWGLTNNPQLSVNAGIPAAATNVVAIAAAARSGPGPYALPCMALRADGSLVTWGYNLRDASPPTNAVDLVAISVQSFTGFGASPSANSLVLRADGTVVNWTSTGKTSPLPAAVTNGNIVAIAAGALHQLVLRDDGNVVAWGSNGSGQTNVPPDATNIVAIAAGAGHSLALRMDGKVIGWGADSAGQSSAFTNVGNVTMIAAGAGQSIGLRADGVALGQIVTNSGPEASSYGHPPPTATNLIAVAAGTSHSLGLRSDRTVTGWGQTNSGALDFPGYATNVVAVAAGDANSLGLVSDPFAPPIPPRFGRPPLSRAIGLGQDAVFNALAIGGLPLRYQWFYGGTLLPGRTNQWLGFTNFQTTNVGDYQLVAMNDFGSVTSVVATVSAAVPRPVIRSLAKNSNGLSFTVDTFYGVLYIAEYSDALSSATWSHLADYSATGAPVVFTDGGAGPQPRYYRVRAVFPTTP